MTRSGNRRRRTPLSPSAGPSHSKDRSQSSGHQRESVAMDSQASASDLHAKNGDAPPGFSYRASAGDGLLAKPDRTLDEGDRQASGQFSDGGGDHRRVSGTNNRQRQPGLSEKGRKDGKEQRIHASDVGHHRRSLSRDRPPYYQHYQKNQRWEGKENSDQKKDSASNEGGKTQEYTPYMASRARELKEEGNRRFQRKDLFGAMDQYELALKLTPANHSDRAVFHSNRAACLMQMKPPQHDAAIHECNLALEVHPSFPRALLRRARAYEAIGKLDLALQDVELLLQSDVSHPDALDMTKRIRLLMEHRNDQSRQDLQGRPPTPSSYSRSKSYAGLSAVPQSDGAISLSASRSFGTNNAGNGSSLLTCVPANGEPFREMQSPPQVSSQHTQTPPSPSSSNMHTQPNEPFAPRTPPMDPFRMDSSEKIIHQDSSQGAHCDSSSNTPSVRPLKLIYDHDIRLAEMPVNCKFGDLRKLVKSKFPSSKAILIKYKDAEGDLVTITSTEELRLAEAAAAMDSARRNLRMSNTSAEICVPQDREPNSAIGLSILPLVLDQLRLHVVEVPAEQEPHDKENEVTLSTQKASVSDKVRETSRPSTSRERDFDKWLLEFAQLFRMHLGIDPSGHVNFHELGLELCAEALEETITTEEAHRLFQQAGSKFQEMVAVGFSNWGNVYMCAARKEIPHDNEDEQQQTDFCERLQAVFEWAHAQYALAEEKFQLSLKVKPDFFDGMLGLGHKDFESAKLNWAFAVASQKDLKAWESSKTLQLFCSAAGHAKQAAEILSRQEESHDKDGNIGCSVGAHQQSTDLEQTAPLRTQIYLFWGNVLYEHSQVEFKLELHSWKELLSDALHKFEVAGGSSSDISMARHKHLSNSHTFVDVGEENVMKENGVIEVESAAEKKERETALQDSDNERTLQIEVLQSESVLSNGAAEHGESVHSESHHEDYDQVTRFSKLSKNKQGDSCEREYMPVGYIVDDADTDSVQRVQPCEDGVLEQMPVDNIVDAADTDNAQTMQLNEDGVLERMPVDNIAENAGTVNVQTVQSYEDGVLEVSMVAS